MKKGNTPAGGFDSFAQPSGRARSCASGRPHGGRVSVARTGHASAGVGSPGIIDGFGPETRSSGRRRGRLGRGMAAVVLVSVAVGALQTVSAFPAAAASPAYVYSVPGTSDLRAVACPTAAVCVAVGENSATQGVVVVITNGSQGIPKVVPGVGLLLGIACPTAALCEAVGTDISGTKGVIVTFTNGTLVAAQTAPVRLLAVACPSAATCQAVGSTFANYPQGVTVDVTNGIPAAAQVVPGADELLAVACETPTTCEAVGSADRAYDGVGVVITNGTPGAAQVWHTGGLMGVACPTPTICQTVGQDFHGVGYVMSIINGAAYNPQAVFGTGGLNGVSCSSATSCQAVGVRYPGGGAVITITNSTVGPAIVAEDTLALLGVSCAGATTCQAVGIDESGVQGVVVTIDATGTLPAASFTYPLDDQSQVDPFLPFSWSTIPQAQAYYLIVGTKLYGADLLNSGVLAATQSYLAMPDLPVGPTIHATLYVEVDGTWLVHESISFTAGLGKAVFTYPVDGQTGVDQSLPFTWSEFPDSVGLSFPEATGYYLIVGTTLYGSDLVSAGMIPMQTSFKYNVALPSGRTLYATLFTAVNGTYTRFQSITFTAAPPPAPSPAKFTYPLDAQSNVDTNTTTGFGWTQPYGAQGYYLIVGTTVYGSDLVNSGVMPATKMWLKMPALPAGRTLYATVYTEVNGSWNYFESISFTAAPGTATFTYPTDRQLNVDTAKPFTWTTIQGAQGYYLTVGSTLYGNDLVNSGPISATQSSFPMPAFSSGPLLYATLYTAINGTWARFQSITFHH